MHAGDILQANLSCLALFSGVSPGRFILQGLYGLRAGRLIVGIFGARAGRVGRIHGQEVPKFGLRSG